MQHHNLSRTFPPTGVHPFPRRDDLLDIFKSAPVCVEEEMIFALWALMLLSMKKTVKWWVYFNKLILTILEENRVTPATGWSWDLERKYHGQKPDIPKARTCGCISLLVNPGPFSLILKEEDQVLIYRNHETFPMVIDFYLTFPKP